MRHPKKRLAAWQEALRFINRCPLCHTSYITEQAQVFARSTQASLLHLTCGGCHSFFVAMVVAIGTGLSSVGMITDLSFTDLKRLHDAPPLTVDELIAGYQALKGGQWLEKLETIS